MYGKPEIVFLPKLPAVILTDGNEEVIVSGRAFRYVSPEVSIIRHLAGKKGVVGKIVNAYERDTTVLLDGTLGVFRYIKTEKDREDASVLFQFIKAP